MRTKKTAKSLYLRETFSKEDDTLKKIREYSEKENVGHMQVSYYEGGILQFLCKAFQVKTVVELGTLYGYSGLMMARALPADGQLFSLDIDKNRQEKAKVLIQNDPSSNKIHFITGPAKESLKTLESKAPFDMVFIDADKGAYMDYLQWSNKNLKSGGLLAADNTFLFGAVYGEPEKEQDEKTLKGMKQFNKEVAQSGLYTSTLIPTEEGLTVGIKK
ncbi:MAG: O-methyltransferase [Bdellovibrionales bacterium]|nr:O-methyltransferase [Bdellovibrionales bacterium]